MKLFAYRSVRAKDCLVTAILLCALCGKISAQGSPTFQHLNIDQGLSSNEVSDMVQDDIGFVWIATTDGLNRYDGRDVKTYYPDGVRVFYCAFKDSKGRLWFGSDNGLIMLDITRGNFVRHFKEGIRGIVTAVTEAENKIWIGSQYGIGSLDEKTGIVSCFRRDQKDLIFGYRKNRIFDLLPDDGGNIWVATGYGLYKYSIETGDVFVVDFEKKGISNNIMVTQLALGCSRNILIGTSAEGLLSYTPVSDSLVHISVPELSGYVSSIFQETTGTMWVADPNSGLHRYRCIDKVWEHIAQDSKNGLASNRIKTLFQDQSGLLWLGTENQGVERMNPSIPQFESYTTSQHELATTLPFGEVTIVCEDNHSNLWVGTRNGLVFIDRKTGIQKSFTHKERVDNTLSDNEIFDIKIDSSGLLWIGTSNALNSFDPKTERWKKYVYSYEGIPRVIFNILMLDKTQMLLGTSGGLCLFDRSTGIIQSQYVHPKLSKILPPEYYTRIFRDSTGNIWVTTSRSGVFKLSQSLDTLHVQRDSAFARSTMRDIAEDSSGNIWIAGRGGLYRIDKITGERTLINKQTGLRHDDLYTVCAVSSEEVWLGSTLGLSRVRFLTDGQIDIKNFEIDGLQGKVFNSLATKLSNGELLFGGLNGFNIFRPGEIVENGYTPPVEIVDFRAIDKEIGTSTHETIVLTYNHNSFDFIMSALSFNHPERNQFAYQLIGFDGSMIHTGTRNYARYTNVPPGRYILHVIASNNDDVWNEEGIMIPIIISPPFWQIRYVQAGSFIILLIVVAFGYRTRIRAVQRVEREKRERSETSKLLLEAKHAAFRSQINPHFVFNCLNSINLYILKSDSASASAYLTKFSRLIRRVLDNSEMEKIPLEQELDTLILYMQLEQVRFDNKFTYRIQIDESVNSTVEQIPPMILQPFVENAIWHGLMKKKGAGEVSITIKREKNVLVCWVDDNGVGRSHEVEKTTNYSKRKTYGVPVTLRRLESFASNRKINYQLIEFIDLTDDNGNPSGTRAIIRIPMEK